ncbi:hypothetical protein SDC9_167895 [bioreactor metagenome]|uniref:Uncharacterized protein n=1 Tax=bioreactor metagenome TaxID=1076179 RepID=A0A645G308_9ZZZZ
MVAPFFREALAQAVDCRLPVQFAQFMAVGGGDGHRFAKPAQAGGEQRRGRQRGQGHGTPGVGAGTGIDPGFALAVDDAGTPFTMLPVERQPSLIAQREQGRAGLVRRLRQTGKNQHRRARLVDLPALFGE